MNSYHISGYFKVIDRDGNKYVERLGCYVVAKSGTDALADAQNEFLVMLGEKHPGYQDFAITRTPRLFKEIE